MVEQPIVLSSSPSSSPTNTVVASPRSSPPSYSSPLPEQSAPSTGEGDSHSPPSSFNGDHPASTTPEQSSRSPISVSPQAPSSEFPIESPTASAQTSSHHSASSQSTSSEREPIYKSLPFASSLTSAVGSLVTSTTERLGFGEEGKAPTGVAGQQSRQSSRDYKETLDAKTQDEKDGTRILNQYHLSRVLGQGAYGVVYEGRLRADPSQIFAVKELSKTRLKKSRRYEHLRRPSAARGGLRGRGAHRGGTSSRTSSQDAEEDKDPLELIRREIAIMKKLDHPNIISLYEVLDDPTRDELYMVVEFCPDGMVIDVKLHEQTRPLKEEIARSYFVQILLGIEYLHSNDIVHRDIKPANILLCNGGQTCKIVDFGVSELFAPSQKAEDDIETARRQGTPAFLSPEICCDRGATPTVTPEGPSKSTGDSAEVVDKEMPKSERETSGYRDDLWAVGVTLYCMVVGHLPFDKLGFMDLYRAICSEEPEYPSHLSKDCVDLLQAFLQKDASKRITIEEARQHPWVTSAGTASVPSAAHNLRSVVGEITEEELRKAINRVSSVFAVARAVTKFKKRRSSAQSASGSADGGMGCRSNDRQNSSLWSSSSSNPSSPQIQQRHYDSPEASAASSRAGSLHMPSLSNATAGLSLSSALNSLKFYGLSNHRQGDDHHGEGSDDPQIFSDEPEEDKGERSIGSSSNSRSPAFRPSFLGQGSGSSSGPAAIFRSGASALTSAINTASAVGASGLGLDSIAEVNTPVSATVPESRSLWPSLLRDRNQQTQTPEREEEEPSPLQKLDSTSATENDEDKTRSALAWLKEDVAPGHLNSDAEPVDEQTQSQRKQLQAALTDLERRLETRMRDSDTTAATKHLANRLQLAMPLDRLTAGLKKFGLDSLLSAFADFMGAESEERSKDDGKVQGKAVHGADANKGTERQGVQPPDKADRLNTHLDADFLQEDGDGINLHTGRKMAKGTASSAVHVDDDDDDDDGADSDAQSESKPRLFSGPMVNSPMRDEMPMFLAAQTLVAISSEKNTGGDDDDDGETDAGVKAEAEAEDGLGDTVDLSDSQFESGTGRIKGEVDDGHGGRRYVERPAIGDLNPEDKHEPDLEPEGEERDGDGDGDGDGSEVRSRSGGGGGEGEGEGTGDHQATATATAAAATTAGAEKSIAAMGFGEEEQDAQHQSVTGDPSKERSAGISSPAVL